jgi:hypothetical protein
MPSDESKEMTVADDVDEVDGRGAAQSIRVGESDGIANVSIMSTFDSMVNCS